MSLDLLPLEYRREIRNILFLYELEFGTCPLNVANFLTLLLVRTQLAISTLVILILMQTISKIILNSLIFHELQIYGTIFLKISKFVHPLYRLKQNSCIVTRAYFHLTSRRNALVVPSAFTIIT